MRSPMRGLDSCLTRERDDRDDDREDVCPDCGWRECLCREEMNDGHDHLFMQGHHEALVCLNTRCGLYGQPQPDVDGGQVLVRVQPNGDNADDWDDDDDEGDDD